MTEWMTCTTLEHLQEFFNNAGQGSVCFCSDKALLQRFYGLEEIRRKELLKQYENQNERKGET